MPFLPAAGQTICDELKDYNAQWPNNKNQRFGASIEARLQQTKRTDCPVITLTAWRNLAEFYNLEKRHDEECEALERSLEISMLIGDSAEMLVNYKKLATAYYRISNLTKAAEYYEAAYEYYLSDTVKLAGVANSLGIVYNRLGLYDKSLKNSLLSISPAAKASAADLSDRYNVLSWTLSKMKRYPEALAYNRQALAYYDSVGDTNEYITKQAMRASIFLKQGNLDSAGHLMHWVEAHPLTQANDSYLASASAELGDLYRHKEEFEKAEDYYQKAIELEAKAKGQPYLSAESALGKVLVAQQRFREALPHLNLVWKAYQQDQHYAGLEQVAGSYAECYLGLNEPDSARHYYQLASDYKDSLFKVEKSRAVAALEVDYDVKVKEALIAYQDSQIVQKNELLEVTKERNAAQERQLLIFTISLVVAAALLVAILFLYNTIRKKNKLVEKRDQEKAILLREIHHRVKNNLSVIASLLNLQSESIEDETALSAIHEGRNRVKSIALIHQKLYQTEDISEINVEEYVDQLGGFLRSAFGQQDANVQLQLIPNPLGLDIDTAVPFGLILNELFTNSFKHGASNNKTLSVKIELSRSERNHFRLRFADNGPGFPEGFNPRKTSSLGVSLLRMLSKQLRGNASFSNDNGAVVTIEFQATEVRKEVE